MQRVAAFSTRRPKLVIAGWLLVVVVLALQGRAAEERVRPTEILVAGTETFRWSELRQGHFGVDTVVMLRGPAESVDRQGRALAHDLMRRRGTRVLSPWSGAAEVANRLRPKDDLAVLLLNLERDGDKPASELVEPLDRFVAGRVESPVEYHVTGEAQAGKGLNEAVVSAIHKGELLAFPILLLILLFVFRSPVAAAVPLVIALGTVQAGFGVIAFMAEHGKIDAIALNLASMIGLALGVDYSLLIVTRFREALRDGVDRRRAAFTAANTAGRTGVFAGSVLVAEMAVTIFFSPGTVLLSASLGAISVALLSMVGAALVTPSVVALLGERVNRFQFGQVRGDRTNTSARLASRLSRRPVVATPLVLVVLLLLAAPVAAMDTTPPDIRQLPASNEALRDYQEVRDRVGPGWTATLDIVVRAPRGSLTEERRLAQLARFQRELARLPGAERVVGPGSMRSETAPLREAPDQIAAAGRKLREGRRGMQKLGRGVSRASDGVTQIREGLALASGAARRLSGGSSRAGAGVGRLADGTGTAGTGAAALARGIDAARRGAKRLSGGLREAADGATLLERGARQAQRGGRRLEKALSRLEGAVRSRAVPGAEELAAGLRSGAEGLKRLREPAQVAETELAEAFEALQAMTVGKADPQYLTAFRSAATALGAMTGRHPLTGAPVADGYEGMDAELARGAREARRAAEGAEALARGARELSDSSRQLAAGAARLGGGLDRLARGNARLAWGVGRLHDATEEALDGVARLDRGSDRLASGLSRLHAGMEVLGQGVGRIGRGADELAAGLSDGHSRTAPLESGLDRAVAGVGRFRSELRKQQSNGLQDLQRRSPRFFESGYLVVAAIEGSDMRTRQSASFILDTDRGGDTGRILVVPRGEGNEPHTNKLIDRAVELTRRFEKDSGLEAAVGGGAPQLLDYERATSSRLPLLIAAIAGVTYLMLVPILRSLFLPLVAVLLNLLTVAVAFGVLTLLFVGDNPPLGGPGQLDVVSVAGMFAVTFALSIDYEVFLLARMREEYVRSQDNERAIQFGLEKTARIVTGAAAVMLGVFGAFALSDFTTVRQFGVGLAAAVFVDATLVRLVLLPALMRLFGVSTWWLPHWLDRWLPHLDVEGAGGGRRRSLVEAS